MKDFIFESVYPLLDKHSEWIHAKEKVDNLGKEIIEILEKKVEAQGSIIEIAGKRVDSVKRRINKLEGFIDEFLRPNREQCATEVEDETPAAAKPTRTLN